MGVYVFGFSDDIGKRSAREFLGGKGAGLREMVGLGIPVPPGFTISTETCKAWNDAKGQFPKGLTDEVKAAMAAGAIKAGGEELVQEINGGWFEFDVAVASPDMMRVMAKLGRVLGPKGLMPSPKNGTVTQNVAQAVKEFTAGKLEYRTDKSGNVHAIIGKMSFADADLAVNLQAFVDTIERARPSSTKGIYIKKICVSGSMTPSVQIKYQQAVVA